MATEPQADLGGMTYSRVAARRPGGATHLPEVDVASPDSGSEDDEPVTIVLDISPELDEAMEDMAIDLDVSKSDVFVRAMTLLQLAIDARKRDKRVCIADQDLDVETEITGFGPLDGETESEAVTTPE